MELFAGSGCQLVLGRGVKPTGEKKMEEEKRESETGQTEDQWKRGGRVKRRGKLWVCFSHSDLI